MLVIYNDYIVLHLFYDKFLRAHLPNNVTADNFVETGTSCLAQSARRWKQFDA
jgi:hypothetical protein